MVEEDERLNKVKIAKTNNKNLLCNFFFFFFLRRSSVKVIAKLPLLYNSIYIYIYVCVCVCVCVCVFVVLDYSLILLFSINI